MALDRAAGTVTVEGAARLRKTMKQAGQDMRELKAVNKEAADIAARASAALAPVKSGRLKRTVRASGTNTAGIIRAGNKGAPYAAAVHWGRKWWPNKSHPKSTKSVVTANPFMSDGARGSEGQWLPVYQRGVDNILERIYGL